MTEIQDDLSWFVPSGMNFLNWLVARGVIEDGHIRRVRIDAPVDGLVEISVTLLATGAGAASLSQKIKEKGIDLQDERLKEFILVGRDFVNYLIQCGAVENDDSISQVQIDGAYNTVATITTTRIDTPDGRRLGDVLMKGDSA